MLLQRIITASILAPLVVLSVLLLPPDYFALLWGLFILLAAWEWTALSGQERIVPRVIFLILLTFSMLFIHFWTVFLQIVVEAFDWPEVRNYSGILEWLVVPAVLWWVLIMVLIRNAADGLVKVEVKPYIKVIIGWFVLFSAWMFLSRLRALYPTEITLYFLLLIWAADIAAYFTGKQFGKIKLAPEISPGKTVAGFYGALVAAIVCALCFCLYIYLNLGDLQGLMIPNLVLLSVLTVMVSVYGDLFFSVAKRQRGVKDSGSLLPGHGGLLDRLDSVIAAIPLFYAGIYLIFRS